MNRIIFYDLETSGIDTKNDSIIEIGAKDNYGNTFNKLINPERIISNTIENLTGITNNKLKYRHTLEQSYELINIWFDFEKKNKNYTEVYLIAHNGDRFDLKFMERHFNIKCKSIDTLTLFRKLLPNRNSHSIKTLCDIYKIDCSRHHRALDDVIILEQLFDKALELYSIKNNIDIDKIKIKDIYDYTYGYY
jgi:DNA polymerase III alpha subunit (gram-positive type)